MRGVSLPIAFVFLLTSRSLARGETPSHQASPTLSISGIHPQLAVSNAESECGIGGVVPWAGRLGVITYGPHLPRGSSDTLLETTPDLRIVTRPEGVGGTPATQMIHDESQQLLLGPHLIDAAGSVRTVPYVYANNGDRAAAAQAVLGDPATPSGALAEWRRPGDDWQLVRRNQFTEVTGPGGIRGNPQPDRDPIWSIGWDHRPLILMVLDQGEWHAFRLPKVSHSYDGAHGWNTEWPRIRGVGEIDLLMTMHGCFWRFPRTISAAGPGGIRPRSTYLKVIGDFCRWNDLLGFGCDDAAAKDFKNTRKAKRGLEAPAHLKADAAVAEFVRTKVMNPTDVVTSDDGQAAVWVNAVDDL